MTAPARWLPAAACLTLAPASAPRQCGPRNDAKVVRALAEGDSVRIAAHRARQAERRTRLAAP